jgi:hypothetical protein
MYRGVDEREILIAKGAHAAQRAFGVHERAQACTGPITNSASSMPEAQNKYLCVLIRLWG